jgi:hypothetical protein
MLRERLAAACKSEWMVLAFVRTSGLQVSESCEHESCVKSSDLMSTDGRASCGLTKSSVEKEKEKEKERETRAHSGHCMQFFYLCSRVHATRISVQLACQRFAGWHAAHRSIQPT